MRPEAAIAKYSEDDMLSIGMMLKDEVAVFYFPQISPIGAEFCVYLCYVWAIAIKLGK